MLRLYSQKLIDKATVLFKRLAPKIYDMLNTRTQVNIWTIYFLILCQIIKLEGLEYMNDDPSEVDVMYVKVHPQEDRITAVCGSTSVFQLFIATRIYNL